MFEIHIVAGRTQGKDPYVRTYQVIGDPDLEVQKQIKELIFQHGFKTVSVLIRRIDDYDGIKVTHITKNLKVVVE